MDFWVGCFSPDGGLTEGALGSVEGARRRSAGLHGEPEGPGRGLREWSEKTGQSRPGRRRGDESRADVPCSGRRPMGGRGQEKAATGLAQG